MNHCFATPVRKKGYLQISAERMIKAISELRHKICQARQNLEHETEVNGDVFSLSQTINCL